MVQMNVYLPEAAKRGFKALCALEGLSLGQKIEKIVDQEMRDASLDQRTAPTTSD